MWMGCLLRDTYTTLCCNLSFPFSLTLSWPCAVEQRSLSKLTLSLCLSHRLEHSGSQDWTFAAPEFCKDAESLHKNDCFSGKKTKTKPKTPPSSFLHPSELLQGLRFF